MRSHFVTFYSPGTFMHEQSTEAIDDWGVAKAAEMAKGITERYGAKPFGFRFTTRERADTELDSKQVASSPMYYLGGKVETLEEVKARATSADRILIANMECNDWDRIITNTNSWKITQPLMADDVVLDWPQPTA